MKIIKHKARKGNKIAAIEIFFKEKDNLNLWFLFLINYAEDKH